MKNIITIVLCLFLFDVGMAQNDTSNITPRPQYFKKGKDSFTINKKTLISVVPDAKDMLSVGKQLAIEIYKKTGLKLEVIEDGTINRKNTIALTIKKSLDSLGDEGYHLLSDNAFVKLSSKNAHGAFYGVNSLVQLIAVKNGKVEIPSVEIYDKPRFEWRGLMLDVGRHFYSVEFIKKMIDRIAMYKMNTFHWHLTDDQGWRIEIKQYPKLTKKAAWRAETNLVRGDLRWIDKNPHGGFYTQEEIKEVVKYAASKFVTIIPEIELPGHSAAALTAYPQYSCSGGPFEVLGQWGVFKEVYCAGNDQTFEFLENILTEVISLFPGKIIHIGGDECPKDRWKACPKCQNRIKQENLKNEEELQSYFIKRIGKFLASRNKTMIGWDEILEGGLASDAMVMSWRGVKGGVEAAKQRHDVVMTPNIYMYLDYYQGERHLEPYSNVRILPVQKVYSFNPELDELSIEEKKHIKGVQANVWTEYMNTSDIVEYMVFPRIAAVAEVGWTSQSLKNWEDFSRRLEYEFDGYEKLGINYAKSVYNVWCEAKMDSISATAKISLKTYGYKTEIRYTLDGTEPTVSSKKYIEPFDIKLPQNIKAAAFKNGKRIGKVNMRTFAIISSK